MPSPPNVLLILCHDLGRRLGCYGVPNLRTPALDALAAEGVQCENYFATTPLCSPSRGSIMTGQYPHSNGLMGLVNRGWDMPDDAPTLAQALSGGGYHALLFGLHHEKKQALRMGYHEHLHPQWPQTCDSVSGEFIAWLRARERAAPPFFACLGFFEVHRDFKHPRYTPDDPARVHVPSWLPDTPETREELANLHGMVFSVDTAMERIAAALDETGYADNTLLLFSTDHGIAFPRAKSTLYDPGIATALLMRWPDGFAGGRRYGELLSNIDLLPTILACAGVPQPPQAQGRSFLPLLRGEGYRARAQVFAEKTWHDAYDPIRAVRTERFKYIHNFPGEEGAPPSARPRLILPADIEASLTRRALARLGDPHLQPRPQEELYALDDDPAELRSLAEEPSYAGVLDDLRARLDRWMEETNDPLLHGPIPCPDPAMQYG
jgi:arylsulfatase A-like enzyme